jgi:hypothetical protein
VHCVTPYTHSGSFQIRLDPYMLEFGHVSKYDRMYTCKRPTDVQHIHQMQASELAVKSEALTFRQAAPDTSSTPKPSQYPYDRARRPQLTRVDSASTDRADVISIRAAAFQTLRYSSIIAGRLALTEILPRTLSQSSRRFQERSPDRHIRDFCSTSYLNNLEATV